MAPTTRSGAKPKTETVTAKQSPKSNKKKPQPKKQAVKKPSKAEAKIDDIKNGENGDNPEVTEEEATNEESSEKSPKGIKRKPQPKKQAGKKPVKTEESEGKKPKVEKEEESGDDQEESDSEAPTDAKTIYEFTVKDIDGNEVSLEKYKGNVCIIVNVASKCGHTKSNYEQFVELFDKYSESNGLKILAFPCNQFGSQEAGTCEKIKAFAENKGVKFDMFDKINVNGKNANPLWVFLKDKLPEVTSGKETGKDIKWNFTKFIIDKEGVPVERYASSTKPLTLVESLEKLW